MTTPNTPIPRIFANQWLRDYDAAKAKREEAERVERARKAAKMEEEASAIVDKFMLKLSNGKNPWAEPPRSELDLGEGDPTVLNMAKEELSSLGYKVRVDHPTDIGPGGRGETQSSWTNTEVWNLYVARPARSG
jgi:hypothetical protein